jgi:hypothetical protein
MEAPAIPWMLALPLETAPLMSRTLVERQEVVELLRAAATMTKLELREA